MVGHRRSVVQKVHVGFGGDRSDLTVFFLPIHAFDVAGVLTRPELVGKLCERPLAIALYAGVYIRRPDAFLWQGGDVRAAPDELNERVHRANLFGKSQSAGKLVACKGADAYEKEVFTQT